MKWLLDTDTVIYCMKEVPAVVGRVEATRPADRYLSLITLGELFFGIFRSAQVERNLRRFLGSVKLLPLLLLSPNGSVRSWLTWQGAVKLWLTMAYGSLRTPLSTGLLW